MIIIIPGDSKLVLLRNVSCGFLQHILFFQELQNVIVSMSIYEIQDFKFNSISCVDELIKSLE